MSTTIYDVYKTSKSISEITDLLINNRKKYLSYIYSHFINQMLDDSVEFYDLAKLDNIPNTNPYYGLTDFESYLRKSFDVLIDNEKEGVFSPDARLIIGLRPMKYKDEEFVLVAPFGSMELIDLFVKDNSEWLTNFEYYDNTDRPDDVTNKEWKKRCDIWDVVFDKYWTRKEAMLTYTYNDLCIHLPRIGSLFRNCDKSMVKIPSDKKRMKRFIRDWYTKEQIKTFGQDAVLNNSYTYLHEFPDKYKKGEFDEQKKQIQLQPLDGELIKFITNEG